MKEKDTLERISELTAEISELPKGYISKKSKTVQYTITINGRKKALSKADICVMMKSRLSLFRSTNEKNCRQCCGS